MRTDILAFYFDKKSKSFFLEMRADILAFYFDKKSKSFFLEWRSDILPSHSRKHDSIRNLCSVFSHSFALLLFRR